jgi:hypothetical protein
MVMSEHASSAPASGALAGLLGPTATRSTPGEIMNIIDTPEINPADLAENAPAPVTMCLIYPGMTDFVKVIVVRPADEPGYVFVRKIDHHLLDKVSVSRLVDEATARERSQTRLIERDGYTVTERTVIA